MNVLGLGIIHIGVQQPSFDICQYLIISKYRFVIHRLEHSISVYIFEHNMKLFYSVNFVLF